MPSAVIVKGNPKFIFGNTKAEAFYNEIKAYLEFLGFLVTMDPGEPYTSPPKADLWIGHSRGVDRLRFAPPETRTLAFGSSAPRAINHPEDASKEIYGPTDIVPNDAHYLFTDEMKAAIDQAYQQIMKRTE